MSKSKKHKNNKVKNQVSLTIDEHFVERLRQRFSEVKLEDIDNIIKFSKKYTPKNLDSCPFQVVKNKLRNPQYSDSVYLVNSKFNMIMVSVNNVLKNVLYLDGTDGYSFV